MRNHISCIQFGPRRLSHDCNKNPSRQPQLSTCWASIVIKCRALNYKCRRRRRISDCVKNARFPFDLNIFSPESTYGLRFCQFGWQHSRLRFLYVCVLVVCSCRTVSFGCYFILSSFIAVFTVQCSRIGIFFFRIFSLSISDTQLRQVGLCAVAVL